MSISYPITLPASPGYRSFMPSATTFAAMAASPWSGAQQVQLNQGQMWGFSLELPPLSDAQARAWFGTLLQLNGVYGTFLFGHPTWGAPRGTWAGSPAVNGPGQSGSTLALDGFTVGATGKQGDYFQLGTGADARLYMVTQDFTADGSGEAQVEIWPRLRTAPADDDVPDTSSPEGVFRLASPVTALSWQPFRHGLSFDIIEAL